MISDIKKRTTKIIRLLNDEYPDSRCSLKYKSAHQLLIATILSAQTTDAQVNKVTPSLFKKFKTTEDFAGANIIDIENAIKSIGLYHNKAKSIKNSSIAILHDFGGIMPDKLDEIIKLPGVGRKTGSVVLGTWFGKAEGIVVDTHVKRIASLLGLTDEKDPYKVELDLMKIINKRNWISITHLLIDHGRAVCIARRPRCEVCVLQNQCPSAYAL
ncbi:MAG: endonuclease III [candidate division Zixibacteria bacterium]|nr:endonuclease III [candidate division Zixibacteria bacterium]